MKLIYLSTAVFPSPLANRLQTMKMGQAFSKICDFKLFVGEKKTSDEEIFDYYSISNRFKIIPLGIPKIKPRVIFSLPRYIKIIKKEKPDFIYIREIRLAFLLSLFFRNIIFEIHDFLGCGKLLCYFNKFFLKRLMLIVATNHWKGSEIKKIFKINENKIVVAPNGVDVNRFHIEIDKKKTREQFKLPLNKFIVGYVGMLETMGREKGIDILIKAIRLLKNEFSNVSLCLVGGPKERIMEYTDLVKKIGLTNNEDVIFVNRVNHQAVPMYLKIFDILVLPYPKNRHYSYYMSPLKLFEYMAAKKPIVASSLPSIKEVLNSENSFLVDPDDPNSLADGIKTILKNPELSGEIASRAFYDVQNYTWENRARNILNFIKLRLDREKN